MTEPSPYWLNDALKDGAATIRQETGQNYGQVIAGFYHGLVSNGVPMWAAVQMCNTYISAAAVAAKKQEQ